MIQHSGSHVLAVHLYLNGIFTQPTRQRDWPLYIGSFNEKPDQAAVINDTQGIPDGRIMSTGRTVTHPGFQFRIRAKDYPTGMRKGFDLRAVLDAIRQQTVTIDAVVYRIHAVRQTSDLLPIGQEEGGARYLFTLNGTITYGENE